MQYIRVCAESMSAKFMVLQVELMRVDIETISELSAGQTVCDVWHQSSKPKNVSVAQVCVCAHHGLIPAVMRQICLKQVTIMYCCCSIVTPANRYMLLSVWLHNLCIC